MKNENAHRDYTVAFETKVYEKDWRFLLRGGILEEMIKRCDYRFDEKVLRINNVNDVKEVRACADELVRKGVIDRYDVVEDHAEEALKHFQVTRENLGKGYNYSISELVGLYRCSCDYLLHFSSDAMIAPKSPQWIDDAIGIMRTNADIVVANPNWKRNRKEAKKESHGEVSDFYLGYGFSDQSYLVPLSVFKQPIFGETHPDSARYPKYGGELFEKRVDSFMRVHGKQRITSKNVRYAHRNFPKTKGKVMLLNAMMKCLSLEAALNFSDFVTTFDIGKQFKNRLKKIVKSIKK
jgi:hypothetical protein